MRYLLCHRIHLVSHSFTVSPHVVPHFTTVPCVSQCHLVSQSVILCLKATTSIPQFQSESQRHFVTALPSVPQRHFVSHSVT
uniref:Uncharacterized protein n=1 Tax=Pararge aegeria TaxID=116150 RepID=S4PEI9_9NEOP